MQYATTATASNQLNFAVIAIESTAQKYGIAPAEMCERLARAGLIEGRLWKYYEMLHTQSRDYVADDLMAALLHRENKNQAS